MPMAMEMGDHSSDIDHQPQLILQNTNTNDKYKYKTLANPSKTQVQIQICICLNKYKTYEAFIWVVSCFPKSIDNSLCTDPLRSKQCQSRY